MATERGLITPIVRNADIKGLQVIANEVKELSSKAQNNKLLPEEYKGGTFSVSNLGMFGIDEFAAVINPPQAAILAVGTGKKVPFVRFNESTNQQSITTATVMKATLSCDGRVIDDEVAFKLLNSIKRHLENPMLMAK